MEGFSAANQALVDVWEAHTAAEFAHKDADEAIATMTDNPVLVHVPVGTGASGKEPLRRFYRDVFIPNMPPDVELELLTRTVGRARTSQEKGRWPQRWYTMTMFPVGFEMDPGSGAGVTIGGAARLVGRASQRADRQIREVIGFHRAAIGGATSFRIRLLLSSRP